MGEPLGVIDTDGWDYQPMTNQEMVGEFHRKFGVLANTKPSLVPSEVLDLRYSLIFEELHEYFHAGARNDLVGVADALGDLLYVVYGAAVTHGIDLQPIFEAIHATNMKKDGGGKRADGKITKPEGWQPPDLATLLRAQGADV